LLKKSSCW